MNDSVTQNLFYKKNEYCFPDVKILRTVEKNSNKNVRQSVRSATSGVTATSGPVKKQKDVKESE